MLHHNGKDPDPASWEPVVKPLPRNGLTEADAYGACLDFVPQLVTRQQMAAVRSRTAGSPRQVQHSLQPLFRDAPWRSQPASQRQRDLMKSRGVSVHVCFVHAWVGPDSC